MLITLKYFRKREPEEDMDSSDYPSHMSPLMLACINNDYATIRLLLEEGCELKETPEPSEHGSSEHEHEHEHKCGKDWDKSKKTLRPRFFYLLDYITLSGKCGDQKKDFKKLNLSPKYRKLA